MAWQLSSVRRLVFSPVFFNPNPRKHSYFEYIRHLKSVEEAPVWRGLHKCPIKRENKELKLPQLLLLLFKWTNATLKNVVWLLVNFFYTHLIQGEYKYANHNILNDCIHKKNMETDKEPVWTKTVFSHGWITGFVFTHSQGLCFSARLLTHDKTHNSAALTRNNKSCSRWAYSYKRGI